MLGRTTLGALAVALLALAAPPSAAKEELPEQVEVHDLRTGTTTLLDGPVDDEGELTAGPVALRQLVGWPSRSREPHAASRGRSQHVATITWRLSGGKTAWVDRVCADGVQPIWVERTDHEYPPGSVSWGRVEASFAWGAGLAGVLAALLALAARGRRQRSVTASRKSRASAAAAS